VSGPATSRAVAIVAAPGNGAFVAVPAPVSGTTRRSRRARRVAASRVNPATKINFVSGQRACSSVAGARPPISGITRSVITRSIGVVADATTASAAAPFAASSTA
jgi:hypothetical protein